MLEKWLRTLKYHGILTTVYTAQLYCANFRHATLRLFRIATPSPGTTEGKKYFQARAARNFDLPVVRTKVVAGGPQGVKT